MQRAFFERFDPEVQKECSKKEYVLSILSELTRILQTRQQVPSESVNYGLPSAYGIPDFLGKYDVANKDNWKKIEHILNQLVSYYEPRLSDIECAIRAFDTSTQTLEADFSAHAKVKDGDLPINFGVKFLLKEGEVRFT